MHTTEESLGPLWAVFVNQAGDGEQPVSFTLETDIGTSILFIWQYEDVAMDFALSPDWGPRRRIVKEIPSSDALLVLLKAAYEGAQGSPQAEWLMIDAPPPEEWPEEWPERWPPPTTITRTDWTIEELESGALQF
jgi:hypothetical protein